MSEFANPTDSAAADSAGAARHMEEMLALIGERDPFELMEGHAAALEEAIRGLDAGALRTPEAEGKWSVIEVLGHLADTELVYGYRVRMILSRPMPGIEGYDQDVWAMTLRYRDADPRDLLETIGALRRSNLRLFRSLAPSQLDRAGMHAERGRESVRQIIHLLAGHDIVHHRQIERIRKATGQSPRA